MRIRPTTPPTTPPTMAPVSDHQLTHTERHAEGLLLEPPLLPPLAGTSTELVTVTGADWVTRLPLLSVTVVRLRSARCPRNPGR